MKVSEKSLELNVGAELLQLLREKRGMPKAYLRGLTQREESQEGVDFFAQLSQSAWIFAFQFKAPKGDLEGEPYQFTIRRQQHAKLSQLAGGSARGVYYVLPYYVRPAKLQSHVPKLLSDTWFLPVGSMKGTNPFKKGTNPFNQYDTRTVSCKGGVASINPEYELRRAEELDLGEGIPAGRFTEWYASLHDESDELTSVGRRKDPWLVRGLRLAIVSPAGERRL